MIFSSSIQGYNFLFIAALYLYHIYTHIYMYHIYLHICLYSQDSNSQFKKMFVIFHGETAQNSLILNGDIDLVSI